MPLVLKDIVGFTVSQVAEILGIKEGTAKSRIHRARMRLRRALEVVLPRRKMPPSPYSRQVCLDLLDAKQEALDRGVPFDDEVICDRCRSVFATLDLTGEACRELSAGRLPPGLRERLLASLG